MTAILHHMDSQTDNVRIGCVWTIINLIVTEETLEARGIFLAIPLTLYPNLLLSIDYHSYLSSLSSTSPPISLLLLPYFPLTLLGECRARAVQLHELGIFDKLLLMKDSDTSLDVKERAKSALSHLEGLQL